ncbi:DUF6415 family natural product biosynthesis protein [Streptomyces niveus]|uniref:DUF6415 family natural product biosynthesis protein n=1 Tax=Streptomyces niveus TaxID=193462 RepID=UPI0036530E6F
MASPSVDIPAMRAAAAELLDDPANPPTGIYLTTLMDQLREHLKRLVAVLKMTSLATDERASAGLGEAQRKLAAGPSSLGPVRQAESLARSVVALCAHAERLEASR